MKAAVTNVKGNRTPVGARSGRMHPHFVVLAVFLAFVALTGGGSRPDILSLVVLRPLSIAVCAWAAWTLTIADVRRHRFAFGMMAMVIGLTLLHLVPLPPALWQALPGRGLVVSIDAAAGLDGTWRPISLTPPETRNALFSLFVPLAILLLGAQLERPAIERLLLVAIGIGLVSGVLGLLQLVGSPTGPLFLYAHTNYGSATGLFANRNHQAIFLATLFPMLAALVTSRMRDGRAAREGYAALAAGLFLVPLLLVTGSRAGMAIGALGLASMPLLLRFRPKGAGRTARRSFRQHVASPAGIAVIGVAVVLSLAALTIGLSRAASVTRLMDVGADQELRFKVWPIIVADIPNYLPLGSGIGSLVQVFQIVEPDRILRPTQLNHAHNEILEVLLTAGIPGAVLVLAAVSGWAVAARRAWLGSLFRDGVLFARLGIVVIGLLALGSIADYPLRTPFLAALLMVAVLWSGSAEERSARYTDREAGLRPGNPGHA